MENDGRSGKTQFEFLPEKIQTLSGSVHQTYSLLEETNYYDSVYIAIFDTTASIYTTAPDYHKIAAMGIKYIPYTSPKS